jgi:hypothetical protein
LRNVESPTFSKALGVEAALKLFESKIGEGKRVHSKIRTTIGMDFQGVAIGRKVSI